MGAPNARRRASGSHARGQHLLRSDAIAAELVAQAEIGRDELVLEIGAGLGRLTGPLASSAACVIAVEIDERLATRLARRFGTDSSVEVVTDDALQVALPNTGFRVFGNLPFGATTAILRRLLDDPRLTLTAVDVVVEWNVARKRASPRPSNLVSLGWQPWWEFRLVRHLQASSFEPTPSIDAGFLSIRPRRVPLLDVEHLPSYRSMLAHAFRRTNVPVGRSLAASVPPSVVNACLRDRGVMPNARPSDLDVFDWVALFVMVQAAGAQKNSSAMPSGSRKLNPEP